MNSIEYFLLGYEHFKRKQYAESIHYYTHALRYDPNFFFSHYQRGECKQALNDLDGALEDFSLAINRYPAYGLTYARRALVKKMKGEDANAQPDFDQAEVLNPMRFKEEGLEALNAGRDQEALVRFDQGVFLLDTCITIDQSWKALVGNQDDTHEFEFSAIWLLWYRAELREKLGNRRGALDDYQRFMRLGGLVEWSTDEIERRINKLISEINDSGR